MIRREIVHGVESSSLPHYEKFDCFNWLLAKRDTGLVRHAGFSFHDNAELLDELLTKYPQMEFVQLQINYLDWESEWICSRACYEDATKHGVPVIVMEPVKGGTPANVPPAAEELLRELDPARSVASWAIRFAASLPNVMCVLSGMSNVVQMEDNLSYMEGFTPLTKVERDVCFRVAEVINEQVAIACTACRYCTDGCPKNICIPDYFSLYNENMCENLEEKGWTANFDNYTHLTARFGKPSDCIACGQCEDMCPQHLPKIETLEQVEAHFDEE